MQTKQTIVKQQGSGESTHSFSCDSVAGSYNWNEVTLCNMLKNEVYIGNTVQNKKTVVSYKVKKIRTVEKENQIKVNNTHESIIEKDVFEKVNSILEKRGTNTKYKYDYLLRGMLYCYHCKRKLQIVQKNNSKKDSTSHPYITCSNYKKRGCFPLNISYEKFEQQIIYIVKNLIKKYSNKEILNSIYEEWQNKTIEKEQTFKKKIEQIDKSIIKINKYLDDIYIDKLKGILLEENYIKYLQRFTLERENLIKQKEELYKNFIKIDEKNSKEKLNKLIVEFLKLDKINKMYLYRLINKIEIDKDKNVYIYFNFSKLNFIHENLE